MTERPPWPEEHEALLREMWNKGIGGTLIAERINKEFGTKYSRNAIEGKASRLKGLYPRSRGSTIITLRKTMRHRQKTIGANYKTYWR